MSAFSGQRVSLWGSHSRHYTPQPASRTSSGGLSSPERTVQSAREPKPDGNPSLTHGYPGISAIPRRVVPRNRCLLAPAAPRSYERCSKRGERAGLAFGVVRTAGNAPVCIVGDPRPAWDPPPDFPPTHPGPPAPGPARPEPGHGRRDRPARPPIRPACAPIHPSAPLPAPPNGCKCAPRHPPQPRLGVVGAAGAPSSTSMGATYTPAKPLTGGHRATDGQQGAPDRARSARHPPESPDPTPDWARSESSDPANGQLLAAETGAEARKAVAGRLGSPSECANPARPPPSERSGAPQPAANGPSPARRHGHRRRKRPPARPGSAREQTAPRPSSPVQTQERDHRRRHRWTAHRCPEPTGAPGTGPSPARFRPPPPLP